MNYFQDKQVAKCLDYVEKLTEWEVDFLHNIADRYADPDKPLTDAQAKVLNRITEKVEFH